MQQLPLTGFAIAALYERDDRDRVSHPVRVNIDVGPRHSIRHAVYRPDLQIVHALDAWGHTVIYPLHVVQYMQAANGAELEPEPRRSVA